MNTGHEIDRAEVSDVRSAHRFDEAALDRYARARVPALAQAGPLRVLQMRGGQSNPTFLLRFGDGPGVVEAVLRKQPPGALLPSAHAVDREHRVLAALHPTGFPVPRPLAFCDDRAILGTPFYLMERVRGRVLRRNDLPGFTPAERGAVYDAMNATLAALHAVDPAAVGLGDYGKPGSYYTRQLARWTRQWEAQKPRPLAALESLVRWLPEHLPADAAAEEARLCHGDFRLENLMFHPVEPRVVAVFDWELSTLGPPLADLAYNCIPFHMPAPGPLPAGAEPKLSGLAGLDLAALGLPSPDAYVARYCARAGRADGLEPFHVAFAMFRLAVILEGVLARALAGNAAAESAREVGALGAVFAERAWAIAEGGL